MAGFPWYRWFLESWRSSETRAQMNIEERGLYRECLDLQASEGSIPKDHETLRRMVGADPEEFARSWPKVAEKFRAFSKGRIVNLRLKEELDRRATKIITNRKSASSGGKQSGKVREAKSKRTLQSSEAKSKRTLENQGSEIEQRETEIERETESGRIPSTKSVDQAVYRLTSEQPLPIAHANGHARTKKTKPEPPGFRSWYTRYPLHQKPDDAARAYKACLDAGATPEAIERYIEDYKAYYARQKALSRDGRDPTPYPASHLRGGTWKEPPPGWEPEPEQADTITVENVKARIESHKRNRRELSAIHHRQFEMSITEWSERPDAVGKLCRGVLADLEREREQAS